MSIGLLQGQVKLYHFLRKNRSKETIFLTFYTHFLEKLAVNDIGQSFWILTWIHYYLLNEIGLD